MINSQHRFHGYNSLNYVYRSGKTFRGNFFGLKSAQNDRRSSYRLAVVISKKVNKSAVSRNRLRRRIYEAVRLLEPKIKKPYDLVITVYSDKLETLNADELTSEITNVFYQAGVIPKTS